MCSDLSEKGEKCRSAVQKSVNDECLKSIAQLGRTFGTDRVIVGCVWIGKEENFRLLERMAKTLPRGTFYKSHLNADCLGTVFSSLSSSLTSLRTESLDVAGGKLLTIRSAKVLDKMPSHIRSIRLLAGDEWYKFDSQVSKWIWERNSGKLIQDKKIPGVLLARTAARFTEILSRRAARGWSTSAAKLWSRKMAE